MPLQAASGLSRAPIPSGIRRATRERVASVREPGDDVAAESCSPLLGEGPEDIHAPPPPANEAEVGGLRTTLDRQRVVVGRGSLDCR